MNWVLQFRQASCAAGASDMGQSIGGNGSRILAELCAATTMDGVIVTTPHQDKPELSAAKSFYVREIFAATGGEFVANEIVNRNDRQPQPVASVEDHPVFERVGKRDAVDSSQQVNSCRRISKLDHRLWLHEILSGDAERRESEVIKGFDKPENIGRLGPDPQIKVARVTGASMRGQRVRADNEELNPV